MKCYYQRERILPNQNVAKCRFSYWVVKPQRKKIVLTKDDMDFLEKYDLTGCIGGKEVEIR